MLGSPDSGTRVDSVMLGAASNSIPPARTCESISGSPPSWLLGNTVTFSRPDDCAPMARAASVNRTVRGWLSGVLTPSLNSNSAAALAGLPRKEVARATDADPSRPLRVIFIFLASPARWRAQRQFPSNRRPPQGRWPVRPKPVPRRISDPTKPFWGTHEPTRNQTGGTYADNKAAKSPLGGSDAQYN